MPFVPSSKEYNTASIKQTWQLCPKKDALRFPPGASLWVNCCWKLLFSVPGYAPSGKHPSACARSCPGVFEQVFSSCTGHLFVIFWVTWEDVGGGNVVRKRQRVDCIEDLEALDTLGRTCENHSYRKSRFNVLCNIMF